MKKADVAMKIQGKINTSIIADYQRRNLNKVKIQKIKKDRKYYLSLNNNMEHLQSQFFKQKM
jgi:hypothetical protein